MCKLRRIFMTFLSFVLVVSLFPMGTVYAASITIKEGSTNAYCDYTIRYNGSTGSAFYWHSSDEDIIAPYAGRNLMMDVGSYYAGYFNCPGKDGYVVLSIKNAYGTLVYQQLFYVYNGKVYDPPSGIYFDAGSSVNLYGGCSLMYLYYSYSPNAPYPVYGVYNSNPSIVDLYYISSTGEYLVVPKAIGSTQITIYSHVEGVEDSIWINITNNPADGPRIISQPQSAAVNKGESTTLSIEASGSNLSYEWYKKAEGASSWSYVGSKSTYTYSVKEDADDSNVYFYCAVFDSKGRMIESDVAVVTPQSGLTITKQPEDVAVAVGDTATVTVEVSGSGLQYEWFYADAGSSNFVKSDEFTSSTYSVEMSAENSGTRIYCKITDSKGQTVTTNTVTLSIKEHTPGAEATCTTAQICTECGKTLVDALGHTLGAEATCTTAQVCTICGETLVDALGHTLGAEATCTTAQICTECGETLVDALGHTLGAEATCTTAQVCTVCGETLAEALGHNNAEGEFADTAHPHIIYKTCSCGEKVNSGLFATVEGCDLCYPTSSGVTVSGEVDSYNPAVEMTVELKQGNEVKYTQTLVSNTFSFSNVASGTYDMVISKPCHLPSTITGIAVGNTDVFVEKSRFELLVGDINGDGYIDGGDVSRFVFDMAKSDSEASDVKTDLNGDGYRDATDVTILSFNLFKTPCVQSYK